MSEQDTRELLEVDAVSILRNAASHTSTNTSIGDMLRYTVPGSGAAPWQLEEDACEALASIIESQLAKLTEERDELQKRNEQLGYANMWASKSEARKIEYIDQLEAERDELQKVVRIQAESFRKIEQELKEAKDGVRGSHDDDKPGDEKAEG